MEVLAAATESLGSAWTLGSGKGQAAQVGVAVMCGAGERDMLVAANRRSPVACAKTNHLPRGNGWGHDDYSGMNETSGTCAARSAQPQSSPRLAVAFS